MGGNDLRLALEEWVRVFMRRSMREFVRWIHQTELTSSQLGALMRLYHQGDCPISDIGADLGITTAAASQMVDRLVQLGLLGREVDPHDRRVRRTALTPKGRKLLGEGMQARLQWLGELEGFIPAEERPAIIASLQRLTQAAVALESENLAADGLPKSG